jgi:hypothetical protein
MRALRELEPPSIDEGFASVERVEFARLPSERVGAPRPQGGVLLAARALEAPGWEVAIGQVDPDAPHLIFDWRPGGELPELAAATAQLSLVISGPIEIALCPHPAGPPTCWCRPPLPGLPLAFARSTSLDLTRSSVVGDAPAHRTLARTLGARYVPVTTS